MSSSEMNLNRETHMWVAPSSLKLVLAAVLCILLAACGFQVRGAYSLPFERLHIALANSSELYAQIKRNVEAGSATRVVANASDAEASLVVLADAPQKNILSLSAAGRVREFELVRTFSFRVADKAGADLIAPSRIVLRRELTFSDDQVLSKEAEELLLWKDMQNDLVQQLMRRLAAAKPNVAPASTANPTTK
jgi:LPS-assembly lipoprotein